MRLINTRFRYSYFVKRHFDFCDEKSRVIGDGSLNVNPAPESYLVVYWHSIGRDTEDTVALLWYQICLNLAPTFSQLLLTSYLLVF